MVQSADHISGLTGASPTVKIGKNGASGAAPSGAVTEIDSTNLPGWYQVAGNATDTNTAGPVALHATAASGDPFDGVVANIVDPTVAIYGANIVNINGQTASASGTITFPNATLASTTNISAGTITTVTNLTNAPTAGDFTATMKTSLNNSTPASITGAVGSVTGAVGSVSGNVGGNVAGSVNSVTSNVTLSSTTYNGIADALLDRDMSTGTDSGSPTVRTPRQAFRILRNKVLLSGTALTVYKEDDTTASWTGVVSTDATALPIVGNDPA